MLPSCNYSLPLTQGKLRQNIDLYLELCKDKPGLTASLQAYWMTVTAGKKQGMAAGGPVLLLMAAALATGTGHLN
jgi:hypothetical protein